MTSDQVSQPTLNVALVGNPNSGKTSVFNALTGLRHKVGNYPGVTVERREGMRICSGATLQMVDLPGTYSLAQRSPDEEVAVDFVMGKLGGEKVPDLLLNICDGSNLSRNLYLTTQILELDRPVLLVLTMMDLARLNGCEPDPAALSRELGIPVVALNNYGTHSVDRLTQAICDAAALNETKPVALQTGPLSDSLVSLSQEYPDRSQGSHLLELLRAMDDPALNDAYSVECDRLQQAAPNWWKDEAHSRYAFIDEIMPQVLPEPVKGSGFQLTSKADRLLLHPVFGPLAFISLMAFVFQAIFTWAGAPTDLLELGFTTFSETVGNLMGEGLLRDLVVNGILAGVLNVVIFLPQIMVLFLAIGILEDSGYMARAAFLMDQLMRGVGLHGRSFVPMMSSFACAVPGIMSARTIESPAARLVTILVAPLMSCSARLPVYTLVIGAFFGSGTMFGFISTGAVVMITMYLLGIVTAAAMAFLFRRTLVHGETPALIMELPPYRLPRFSVVLRNVFDRAGLFLKKVWTVILALTVILWFLQTFPQENARSLQYSKAAESLSIELVAMPESDARREELINRIADTNLRATGAQLEGSYAGKLGHFIEPVIRPLGFDWQIGVGLVASFAAREVLVSTMAQILSVEDSEDDVVFLQERFRTVKDLDTGEALYRPLTGLSLLVFFVLACQCMSTLAVVRRETVSWRWPLFMLFYMTVLAWGASFIVWQVGTALGY
ncbi:MAG: ferrous iron transport protein B [Planctomycetota bacterium]